MTTVDKIWYIKKNVLSFFFDVPNQYNLYIYNERETRIQIVKQIQIDVYYIPIPCIIYRFARTVLLGAISFLWEALGRYIHAE
jgi:hypothetical protein